MSMVSATGNGTASEGGAPKGSPSGSAMIRLPPRSFSLSVSTDVLPTPERARLEASKGILNATGPSHAARRQASLEALRRLLGKKDTQPLRIVGIGAGAWGSVFIAMIQEAYENFKPIVDVKIWRRGGKAVEKEFAEKLFNVINERENVLRRLLHDCAYLKYVEARLGDRTLYADEILRDGFCVNMIDTPLCPLQVVTNLQEAVWDADIVINSLPSTETRAVFTQIGRIWKDRNQEPPVIISLSKGVEAGMSPEPHIITPSAIIHQTTKVPLENILYLGGPNIASEIYNREYANARLCGEEKWRRALAGFLRQPHFVVWDNSDLVTHEVMGGLKNVYAIGAGLVAGLTEESATSKSVYFAHATSEMIFITHLLTPEPEGLAGPLLADTYVTLLKGRNSWYGERLATGELTPEMGDMVKGKGMIQGVTAVAAFYKVLASGAFHVKHPMNSEMVEPIELCPILQMLYRILHIQDSGVEGILLALRDEDMYDPRHIIDLEPRQCYFSTLLGRHPSFRGSSSSIGTGRQQAIPPMAATSSEAAAATPPPVQ